MANLFLILEGSIKDFRTPSGGLQDRIGGMSFEVNMTLRQHDSKHFFLDLEVPTGKYEFTTTHYNEETDEETPEVLTVEVAETLVKGKVRPMEYVMPASFEVDGNKLILIFEE